MRNPVKGILCLIAASFCISLCAQKGFPVREPDMNRPQQFANLPQQLNCNIAELETLLKNETGKSISLTISENLIFRGVISSLATSKESVEVQSVVVRSTNFPGSILSFSKISLPDGSVRYTGRIISFQHADAYEINLENEQYVFIKKGFYDLVNE